MRNLVADNNDNDNNNENDNRERRHFARMPVSVMIRIRSENEAETFISNYTRDLGLGGLFLKSLSPKSIGTPVCIQLPSPVEPGYAEIHGKVVSHNKSTYEGLITGMGIEFTKMDDPGRVALQGLIRGDYISLFAKTKREPFNPKEPPEEVFVRVIENLLGLITIFMAFVLRNGNGS